MSERTDATGAKCWMRTYNGHTFFPLTPDVGEIEIEVIGHHLAKAQRYAGAPDDDYTVAEHSVHISKALDRDGHGVRVSLQGLLHDSPEFAFGDQIRPVKNGVREQFPEAYHFMQEAQEHLSEKFALKFGAGWPFDPAVKLYDDRIVTDEIAQLFTEVPWGYGLEPLGVTLYKWPWRTAKYQFLERFDQLVYRLRNGEK